MKRLLAMSLLLVGCSPDSGDTTSRASRGPLHFTDVTATSGVDIVWTSGDVPSTQIVEAKGGGVALIDYDGDGDLDLFVPNGATMRAPEEGPGCRLYKNTGDMTFTDVTSEMGLSHQRWSYAVAVGDYDDDGRDDLFVTCFGRNALLRNTAAGFEDVTSTAGVGGDRMSTAAAFGDIDGDGDLDLYVANYVEFDLDNPPPPSTFKGAPVFKGPIGLVPAVDEVYENLGDGTFRDVTSAWGFDVVPAAYGLGVVMLDFDADGQLDVYVGNDSTPNFLFERQGDVYVDTARLNGLSVNVDGAQQSTMGIAIADVSGNGWPDVFTTNFSNDSNTLHVNKDGAFFDDETRRFGVGMSSFPYVGWAAGFYDFDLDGDEDLLAFNGHVYPNATRLTMDAEYDEEPLLYAREGSRFRRVDAESAGAWLAERHCDRGAAFGDLDGDGDVDVVVVELNGLVRVLQNDAPTRVALTVDVEDAIGAVVSVGQQQRWIASGGSFASASTRAAHFGLATPGEVDVTVRWVDGHTVTRTVTAPGRVAVSRE